ncbi:MAG TPA: APC family permease [Gemmatimonadaceae bacterium]|nr:APC family permease [Gemmatimonadaceae bacterium]
MPTPLVQVKRVLFGRPLPSDRLDHERLNKKTALAVLSSDAISSVAYATDQILFVLGGAIGAVAIAYVVPISAVIVGLLVLVGISYSQTIHAYPGGGGSYTVARENLGVGSGLIAAAALLTDYILTVAVSISSGVAAITSAYHSLFPHTVALCVLSIALLTIVNLRGVRESGAVFSVPTYAFIAMMLALLGFGAYHAWSGDIAPLPITSIKGDPRSVVLHPTGAAAGFALFYLLLRGFAEGCAAMTGTEAISNGIQAFKQPSSRNARITLGWMVGILATFFLGVSYLAHHYEVMPSADQTVLSLLGHRLFGTSIAYYALQYSTFAVLVLAANTAFADFPRLSSILARDGFMPRQFLARGDRLAFSNGIITLGIVALLLVVLFGGDTARLVPLYALGVFVCFTLSQAGMVMHWLRSRDAGWKWRAALNGLGALATAIVSVVQVVTKFSAGGWVIVVIIPVIIYALRRIHRHYEHFAKEVAYTGQSPIMFLHHTVVVPVNGITKPTAGALVYATTISEDVRAVYVEVDPTATAELRRRWDEWDIGVELTVIPSPFRSVLRPLVDFVNDMIARDDADLVTIVVPEIVPRSWWGHLLHNKTALFIRTAFLFRPNVVVTAIPYLIGRSPRLRDLMMRDEFLDSVEERAVVKRAS